MTRDTIQVFKPKIREEAIQAVADVLRSGWIGLGPKVKEFEAEFASYIGTKHAIALNSCTSALHMALILANVKPGQVVFTTPLTFASTNLAIKYIGARPHFIDVDNYRNLDPACLEKAVKKYAPEDIGAVIVVHYSGIPARMNGIKIALRQSGRTDIPIIEDCAHACGSAVDGKKVGAEADLACFSFQAVKNLPAGDGGMLTTNSDEIAERARRLAWCGIDKSTFSRTAKTGEYLWQYDIPEIGYKYHMNDITAAIALEQLKYIDEDNNRRSQIANKYLSAFNNHHPKLYVYAWDQLPKSVSPSYHFLPLLFKHRDEVLMKLRERGINCGVHYMLNNMFEPFKECPFEISSGALQSDVNGLAGFYEKHLLTLPIHLHLTDEDIAFIIKSVYEVCDEIKAGNIV